MKPYPHKFQQPIKEKVYNYRLSRARRIVENAVGISSRFPVFRIPVLLTPNTTIKLINAACALHAVGSEKTIVYNPITVDIEDQN